MVASGFLLASEHYHHFGIGRLIAVMAGMALVIASACVFNNYIDRGIDKKMARTSKRALVTEQVSGQMALSYAIALGVGGFVVLAIFTNWRTVLLNAVAIFSYVVLYGIAKRKTVHGTLVGTIPGAIPPAAGYVAVSNRFDGGALLLFLILVFWQMPHFYAIAMYRFKDYKAAGLPVMPVKHGMKITRTQIITYIAGLAVVSTGLAIFGYTGYVYLAVIWLLCFYWLWRGLIRYKSTKYGIWGRKMFLSSLIVLLSLSIIIPLGSVLP
jgi:protoheme IX farnesyltransferase